MGILSWIIFGLIAGILAKWIMPGKDGGGFFMTIILGIVGAVVGGWISTFFGFGKVDGFNFGSFAVAVIGAIGRAVNLQKNQKLNAELSEIIKATTGSLYYSK
ncbi:TPA: GlsB/YeaQ/YmgE family stress response membrane protein [Salmonella enterica]|nr:GlsB/YeaQ/YmgE family stress response membrane protein [Salmonella enterica]